MKFTLGLSNLFTSPSNTKATDGEIERVLAFTISLIVRQDLIVELINEFNISSTLDKENRVQKLIQVYLKLEDFILKNKPLVVKKEYTRETLHEEIRQYVDLQRLPEKFKLIFLPEKEQLFTLFSLYTKELTDYITAQIGQNEVSKVLATIFPGTSFTGFSTTDGQAISIIHQKLSVQKNDEIAHTFKQMNTLLYKHIADSFGFNTAFELTEKNYNGIKNTYGYYLISQYLQAVPDGVLDQERVTFMTREELEKQAMMVTKEEVLRREMAEKLASNLRQENTIIEQKVKEQTFEINQEKEALKKAIERMNVNFIQAKRNEAMLLASVKSLSMGFILTDIHNSVVIHNEAAKKVLRISDDINSINVISIKLKDNSVLSQNIEKSRRENLPIIFEETTIHEQILNITISPVSLSEPNTEYIGSVILIDDITEDKRLERTKDEFFAIASHELRTPLTSIMGSISIIREQYNDQLQNEELKNLIHLIDKSSHHLIGIVNQFLDVSLLELGRIIFKYEHFEITDLLKGIISDLSQYAQNKNLYLKLDEKTQESRVYADKEKTRQILENLISNGIKFSENGGVTIHTELKDDHILIKVSDTGIGIKPENQAALFQKFRQADDILTHDATKGTGLGLYISKKLIENMNGKIYLEKSEEHKGSTFVFSLPMSHEKQE